MIQESGASGVLAKRKDALHRAREFDYFMCHNENAIGEEGNGTPPNKIHSPRKYSEHYLWFLPCSKSSMLCSITIVILHLYIYPF